MYTYDIMALSCHRRMVHVSRSTLLHLNDTFTVVDGEGGLRDAYIKERGVETFLISPKLDDIKVRYAFAGCCFLTIT